MINSNKQTLISVFGAFEEIWLIDWLVIKWWWELIDWLRKRREDKQESTKLSNIPFSQNKQTNKQKRGKERQFNQTHPKDKSQSKPIEPNRTETKRNERETA